MAPATRHEELLLSRYRLQTLRYDWKGEFGDFEHVLVQETYVFRNSENHEMSLFVLPPHTQELQLNMNASDGRGEKLSILSKQEIDATYVDIFTQAAINLRTAGVPMPEVLLKWTSSENIEKLVSRPEELRKDLEDDDKGVQIAQWMEEVLAGVRDAGDIRALATAFLIEYFVLVQERKYRPVLRGSSPVAPTGGLHGDRVLVQYRVRAPLSLSPVALLKYWVFGSLWVTYNIDVEGGCSSHARLVPPKGLTFTFPSYLLNPELNTVPQSELYQLYRPVEPRQTWKYPHLWNLVRKRIRFPDVQVRLSQTPSSRVVTAAMYASLLLLPLLTAIWDSGADFAGALPHFAAYWRDMLAVESISPMYTQYAIRPEAFVLPLGAALIVLVWNSPAVRPYALAQVVVLATLSLALRMASAMGEAILWALAFGVIMFVYQCLALVKEVVRQLFGMEVRLAWLYSTSSRPK